MNMLVSFYLNLGVYLLQKPTVATQLHAVFLVSQQLGQMAPSVNTGFSPGLLKPSCTKQSHEWSLSRRSRSGVSGSGGGGQER